MFDPPCPLDDSALTCSKLERLTFTSKHAMKGFTVKSRVPNLDYDFWSALLHRPVLCPIHILGSGNHQRSDNPRQTPQHGAPPGHVSAGLFEGCLMLMLNGTALTFMILLFLSNLHCMWRSVIGLAFHASTWLPHQLCQVWQSFSHELWSNCKLKSSAGGMYAMPFWWV